LSKLFVNDRLGRHRANGPELINEQFAKPGALAAVDPKETVEIEGIKLGSGCQSGDAQ